MKRKPHMRLFPYIYICGCLAVLLLTSSCGKSSIEGNLTGKWKLVSYSGGPTNPRPALGEILTLRTDTYEIRYNDSLISSGIYHVANLSNSPRSVLYFSMLDEYGSWISFNKDTLVLTYAGIITALYTTPISKYIRVP